MHVLRPKTLNLQHSVVHHKSLMISLYGRVPNNRREQQQLTVVLTPPRHLRTYCEHITKCRHQIGT